MKEPYVRVSHKPTDKVFPDAGDYCRFWFEPAMKAAKVNNYTWPCNRHTFCSWLAMAGASMKEIQELAGHKTISMTASYMHPAPQVTVAASERMVTV
jgi:integrase